MTDDEVAVYQTFLRMYTSGTESLNLANRTTPADMVDDHCLKGIDWQDLASLRKRSRLLSPDVVKDGRVNLVDPVSQTAAVKSHDPGRTIPSGQSIDEAVRMAFEAGLLQVSEIIFDRTHQHALLSYSFNCGMLCGHGGAIIFIKVRGRWTESKRRCGGWIS